MTNSLYPIEKAKELAKTLNNDPEDDWTYTVEEVSEKYARIIVIDEDDFVVGAL